jgi:hypothetical protein
MDKNQVTTWEDVLRIIAETIAVNQSLLPKVPADPPARRCGHCDAPLPAGKRRDAKYCDDDCRRAANHGTPKPASMRRQIDRARAHLASLGINIPVEKATDPQIIRWAIANGLAG